MITLIAAVGRNNEIGLDNKLLCSIPEDMKHFRSYTMGKMLVMGRKTFESIGSKTLPGRTSVVITSGHANPAADTVFVNSIEEAMLYKNRVPELVVIGGAQVYNQTMCYADKLVITHIDCDFNADSYFPIIDNTKWMINSVIDGEDETYRYKFVEYVNNESMRVSN